MSIESILKERFSVRAFTNKPVPQEILERIFDNVPVSYTHLTLPTTPYV